MFWRATPETGSRKFKGYRLVGRIPEFRYLVDGVEVREILEPVDGGSRRRRMTAGKPTVEEMLR